MGDATLTATAIILAGAAFVAAPLYAVWLLLKLARAPNIGRTAPKPAIQDNEPPQAASGQDAA